jgi:hypothetical protein
VRADGPAVRHERAWGDARTGQVEPDQAVPFGAVHQRDTRAVRVALTPRGSRLAAEFYAETCRRIDRLPAGLSDTERGTLAGLLGRVVLDNEVPVVFLEQGERDPSARPT